MEWPSTVSWNVFGSAKTNINMIEQAKEELQILETHHPNKFEYMKLELRSFISSLESHNSDSLVPSSSSATTQESSSNRKRKHGSLVSPQGIEEPKKKKLQSAVLDSVGCTKRSRIDVVMDRAQACLHKIQLFKTRNK